MQIAMPATSAPNSRNQFKKDAFAILFERYRKLMGELYRKQPRPGE
ncbi:MAG: hypothetical protein WBO95_07490 [Candidatus Dechloromonas phosphoritropha]